MQQKRLCGRLIESSFLIPRKIPWINIYAEVNQEKEQEMIGSVGQGDSTPKITLSEFTASKELMEKELDARVKSKSKSNDGSNHCFVWRNCFQLSVCRADVIHLRQHRQEAISSEQFYSCREKEIKQDM